MAYKEYDKKTLLQVQQVEMTILDEFVRVCEKNNLKYFLVGGTLLGAVRHQGFIPWDDDIDVGMLREDYEKFLKIANKELGDDYYLENNQTDKNYCLPFAKIMKKNTLFVESVRNNIGGKNGIFIDIFPFENVKANNFWYRFRFAISYAIIDTIFYKKKLRPLKKTMYPIVSFVFSILPKGILDKILHYIVTRNKDNQSNYVSVIGAGYGYRKELMKRSDLLPLKKVKFANKEYYGMANNHIYLQKLYGDYMQLPPKEKRINHMPFAISFDIKKQESYSENDLKKLQKTLVEILDEFVRICDKYHLEYFLVSGALLGAIRHQGFIPWDDDIDVTMPREDYEKFLKIANDELDDEFFLDYYKTDVDNHFGFAKIKKNKTSFIQGYQYSCHNGFFLDIFPMDYCDNRDSLKTKISASLSRCLLETLKYKDHNLPKISSLRRPIISLLFVPFSNQRIHRIIEKLYTLQNKGTKANCAIFAGVYYYKKEMCPYDVVFPYQLVTFEKKKYHAFHNPDAYLKGLYGNYMQLPKEEMRYSHRPHGLDFEKGDSKITIEEYNKINRK